MTDMLRAQSANLLTGLRVALTPVFMAMVWAARGHPARGALAGGIFIVIAASDVCDGRLARRYRHESPAGRLFDHCADIGFLLGALCTYVRLSLAPWWVPAAVGGSFAFYCFDSWARRPGAGYRLIGSRLGHLAGICNYTLVGVLAFDQTAGIHLLPLFTWRALFWLVPVYSAAAVASRIRFGASWQQAGSEWGVARH